MANTGTLQLPGGLKVFVQGFTNAANTQKVTITPPSGTAAVFSGAGEGNVPMKLAQQGFLSTGPGWPFFTVPGSAGQLSTYQITCTNSGSTQSRVEVNESINQNPDGGRVFLASVNSEDSTDRDFNDSLTLFTAFTAQ